MSEWKTDAHVRASEARLQALTIRGNINVLQELVSEIGKFQGIAHDREQAPLIKQAMTTLVEAHNRWQQLMEQG